MQQTMCSSMPFIFIKGLLCLRDYSRNWDLYGSHTLQYPFIYYTSTKFSPTNPNVLLKQKEDSFFVFLFEFLYSPGENLILM